MAELTTICIYCYTDHMMRGPLDKKSFIVGGKDVCTQCVRTCKDCNKANAESGMVYCQGCFDVRKTQFLYETTLL